MYCKFYNIMSKQSLNSSNNIMQSMVNRWKDKLGTIQQKPVATNSIPPHPPKPQNAIDNQSNVNMKKSVDKSKKSLHSHEQKVLSSKRITTPSKKKQKNVKSQTIQRACQQIFEIFAKASINDKSISTKIKNVLEEVWSKSIESLGSASPRNLQTNAQLQTSIMRESTMSNSAAKRHQRLYQDLQKRYFEVQKEKQYLKSRIQQIVKKYENVERQLERYGKMQKLVNKCIERQQQLKQDNKKLKQELHLSQLRQIEQQKIFQQEINIVRELVDQIKLNLPKT